MSARPVAAASGMPPAIDLPHTDVGHQAIVFDGKSRPVRLVPACTSSSHSSRVRCACAQMSASAQSRGTNRPRLHRLDLRRRSGTWATSAVDGRCNGQVGILAHAGGAAIEVWEGRAVFPGMGPKPFLNALAGHPMVKLVQS